MKGTKHYFSLEARGTATRPFSRKGLRIKMAHNTVRDDRPIHLYH